MIDTKTIDAMARGYLECAAWADAPEGSRARFSKESERIARQMVRAFCIVAEPLIVQALEYSSPYRLGFCLWLTRCGHGSGFWDEGTLSIDPAAPLTLRDRENKPYTWAEGATLGDALSAACYGTDEAIAPFAYPSLDAWRGWLTFTDVDPFKPWPDCPSQFWRQFRIEHAK
jgi:hypothetical protein